jgi:cellulose biosynthesis protein BcsQ
MAEQSSTPAPILLLSGRPDRLAQVRANLRASPLGQKILAAFVFDPVQAHTVADAKIALARGYDGQPHRILFVDGDIALSMSPEQLQALKDASLVSWGLIVMGLTERDDEHAKLVALGIRRVCNPTIFADDFKVQFPAAKADLAAAYAAMREKMTAASAVEIEIERNPSEGLLRDGGIIAVHATKGGSGKTTIATNLAFALARSGRSTILADLNPDGAVDHLHFWKWIAESQGLEAPEELFEYKGLSQLARRLEARGPFVLRPEVLENAIVPIEDRRLKGPDGKSNLALLPGVEDQGDYAVGGDGDKSVARLLSQNRWVENLVDLLSAPSGGFRYVVLDTGTNRYTAPGLMAVSRSDLLIIVVDASTMTNVQVERSAWKRLTDPIRGMPIPMRAKRLLVVNRLSSTPGAPRFEDVIKEFEFLEFEEARPVRFDHAAFVAADRRGIPLLADPSLAMESLAGRDLIGVVNTISRIYNVDEERKGGLLGRFIRR